MLLALALQDVFKRVFVKQVELGLVAEEAGFVNGQVFQQFGQFVLALRANQQPVIAVEGIEVAR